MPLEFFIPDPESEYGDGVMLEEYNGEFGIVAARKSNTPEGTVYKRWCFPQKRDRSPTDKAIPMKVVLGSRRRAVQVLQEFIKALAPEVAKELGATEQNSQEPKQPPVLPDDEDIPF